MRLLFVLGTNPELSTKEIEATATILPFQWNISMLHPGILELKSTEELEWEEKGIAGYLSPKAQDLRHTISDLQERLGGTLKILYAWKKIEAAGAIAEIAKTVQEVEASGNRWTIGAGHFAWKKQRETLALDIKKALRTLGLSVRYVPLQGGISNSSAAVWHNRLDLNRFTVEHPGLEITIFPAAGGEWLAATLTVQDIESYSKRDFGIPVADATSGMLPPKLAQIMVNLAVGKAGREAIVYDPFCGNGRILLEADRMGISVFGSDIDQIKVDASHKNVSWATQTDPTYKPELRIWQADATKKDALEKFWTRLTDQEGLESAKKQFIVSEPYLGKPMRGPLPFGREEEWLAPLAEIYLKFFSLWAEVEKSKRPTGFVMVFPDAKVVGNKPASLFNYLFDRLAKLGYSPTRLSHYSRPDAVVGRDIVSIVYSR